MLINRSANIYIIPIMNEGGWEEQRTKTKKKKKRKKKILVHSLKEFTMQ